MNGEQSLVVAGVTGLISILQTVTSTTSMSDLPLQLCGDVLMSFCSGTGNTTIYDPTITGYNGYHGGAYQQAISALTNSSGFIPLLCPRTLR